MYIKVIPSSDSNFKTQLGGHIVITPQMIITAVKRLRLHKMYVPSDLISKYLRYTYPVRSNLKLFTEELAMKLACAVHVGLLLKHGEDAYYLPTFRQSANDFKSAYMEFWEIYHKVIVNLIKSQSPS